MKNIMDKIKRSVGRETVCVNTAVAAACAAAFAVLGLIFTVGCIDWQMCAEIVQPKFYLPPFFMFLFNIKPISIVLSVCTLLLCFTWIPLVYTASCFLIGALVYLAVLLFSAVIFKFFFRINRAAAWLVLIFAVFALYMSCYSFTLFIIN